MDLETITLPPDWDAQKDCHHFTQDWSPVPSYTEALWKAARFHYGNFRGAVARALHCAYEADATLTRIEPFCLATAERIEIALDSVRRQPQVFADPARLLEYLLAAQFAEGERVRVLTDYRLAGDGAWMYPVVELIHLLGNVAAELRDTVECEEEARPQNSASTAVHGPAGSSSCAHDGTGSLRLADRLCDLTVEQLGLLCARLEQVGVALWADEELSRQEGSKGYYWLGDEVTSVLVTSSHTVNCILRNAAEVRALIDELNAEGAED